MNYSCSQCKFRGVCRDKDAYLHLGRVVTLTKRRVKMLTINQTTTGTHWEFPVVDKGDDPSPFINGCDETYIYPFCLDSLIDALVCLSYMLPENSIHNVKVVDKDNVENTITIIGKKR